MKAPQAFTSLLAPDIARYLTVKQALGREYDGVRRVLAHVDHFLTTRGGDLTPDPSLVGASHSSISRPAPAATACRSCGISAAIDAEVCRRLCPG